MNFEEETTGKALDTARETIETVFLFCFDVDAQRCEIKAC